MKTRRGAKMLAAAMLVAAAGIACGGDTAQREPTMEPGGGTAAAAARGEMKCPTAIQRAGIEVSDVTNGVEMLFRGQEGDESQLMQHVRQIAQAIEMRETVGSLTGGQQPGGLGGLLGSLPASNASVESITRGARLLLKPEEPSGLDALRDGARQLQSRMLAGECPAVSGAAG